MQKPPVNLVEIKKNRTCIRYPTWWWGRYIQWDGKRWVCEDGTTFPESQVDSDYELYNEDEHGAHNERKS